MFCNILANDFTQMLLPKIAILNFNNGFKIFSKYHLILSFVCLVHILTIEVNEQSYLKEILLEATFYFLYLGFFKIKQYVHCHWKTRCHHSSEM